MTATLYFERVNRAALARLPDVLLEDQEVPHLARLRHRREQLHFGEFAHYTGLCGEFPRVRERGVVAVDERKHVVQVWRAVRRGKIDERLLAGEQRADVPCAVGHFECHQFHRNLLSS